MAVVRAGGTFRWPPVLLALALASGALATRSPQSYDELESGEEPGELPNSLAESREKSTEEHLFDSRAALDLLARHEHLGAQASRPGPPRDVAVTDSVSQAPPADESPAAATSSAPVREEEEEERALAPPAPSEQQGASKEQEEGAAGPEESEEAEAAPTAAAGAGNASEVAAGNTTEPRLLVFQRNANETDFIDEELDNVVAILHYMRYHCARLSVLFWVLEGIIAVGVIYTIHIGKYRATRGLATWLCCLSFWSLWPWSCLSMFYPLDEETPPPEERDRPKAREATPVPEHMDSARAREG